MTYSEKLTGKWRIEKRRWSGWNIYVEVKGTYVCPHTFDISPEFTTERKATEKDIKQLQL